MENLVQRLREEAGRDDLAYRTVTVLMDAALAIEQWEKLKDPNVLHINLLRCDTLTLTEAHLRHLLGNR